MLTPTFAANSASILAKCCIFLKGGESGNLNFRTNRDYEKRRFWPLMMGRIQPRMDRVAPRITRPVKIFLSSVFLALPGQICYKLRRHTVPLWRAAKMRFLETYRTDY